MRLVCSPCTAAARCGRVDDEEDEEEIEDDEEEEDVVVLFVLLIESWRLPSFLG